MKWVAIGLALALCACSEDAAPTPCQDDRGCDAGFACVDGTCDSRCDDQRCQERLGERAECWGGSGGECRPVECGRIVPCASSTHFCDLTSFTCYPESGSCQESADCPLMFNRSTELGLACQERTCRFPAPPPSSPADAPGGLSVVRPRPGEELDASEALEIDAPGPSGVYFFVVNTTAPRTLREIGESAVWQLVVRDPGVVRWSDGNGPDLSSATYPPRLPENTPLFLNALLYERGRLRASSPSIPFTIAAGWKAAGAACDDAEEIPGTCWHPVRLQGCSFDHLCEIICASNRDCTVWAPTSVCRAPNEQGIRYCTR